jgi:hypothetical protein
VPLWAELEGKTPYTVVVNIMVTAPRPAVSLPAVTGMGLRAVVEQAQPVASAFGRVIAFCQEAVLLLLVVLLIPIAILVVGTPITLLVRALIEIAQRF